MAGRIEGSGPGPDVSRARSVVVLGMHRSGTSVVTRLLNLLGLALCWQGDLMPLNRGNPAGYWESKTVVRNNDLLLARAGGCWWCPPPAEALAAAGRAEGTVTKLASAFHLVHTRRPWVCKDPRLCLTLRTWLPVFGLEAGPAVVLVLRDPSEIAVSLHERNGMGQTAVLALWERYMRSASAACAGPPVLVTSYDAVLASPKAFCAAAAGMAHAEMPPAADVEPAVRPSLRHHFAHGRPGLSTEQVTLIRRLEASCGLHARWQPPELPPETASTAAAFEGMRRGPAFGALRWLRSRRIYWRPFQDQRGTAWSAGIVERAE